MTIDEAIKELSYLASEFYNEGDLTERAAVGLGIGALERLQQARGYGFPGTATPLPGETT